MLTVVELPIHRYRLDVFPDGIELLFLDSTHLFSRVEDEHTEAVKTAVGLPNGAPRITGGGHQHCDLPVAGPEMGHHTCHEACTEILKGGCRSPVESHKMSPFIQLLNGDFKVVGVDDYSLQIITVYLGAEILVEKRAGNFSIRLAH